MKEGRKYDVIMKYYITAIQPEQGPIEYVSLHEVQENGTVEGGYRRTKEDVLALLDEKTLSGSPKNKIYTAMWNYASDSWGKGAEVLSVGTGARRYLRSKADSTERDNLGHLLPANHIA